MKPIFALLTATGMRRSELLGCKCQYVDGTRILLPTSKNDTVTKVRVILRSAGKGGASAPEATRLQGLKAQPAALPEAAGVEAPPFQSAPL